MAELTREARQVLAEMELLSYGKAASWNSSGGKGEKENPVPQGDANPLHEQWRQVFEAAKDAQELAWSVYLARQELDGIRRRDSSSEAPAEEPRVAWEARLIEEGEGYEARHVATSFNTAVKTVTDIRKAHGRDPNNGQEVGTPGERARQLEKQGLKQAQIARVMGVSQPSVSRLLMRPGS